METRSLENALRDLAQREHKVRISTARRFSSQEGRILEVFDDYLVLRKGKRKDRDILFPLGNITSIHITKLAE